MINKSKNPPYVGLFITCLVDSFRPNIGFATVKLLEQAGCKLGVPEQQTCCGQPAFNSGDLEDSRALARQTIDAFAEFDYVVAPSGSCASMMKKHYVELFEEDTKWKQKAEQFSAKCFELVSFLTDVLGVEDLATDFNHSVTYHDSCSGLRELGVQEQPRQLLSKIQGLTLKEMKEPYVCCGFGGTFCVKFPDISTRMVSDKVENIQQSQAEILLAGDLGCLMNMAGRLKRLDSPVKVYHVAEVLAGMAENTPAIGEGEKE